MDTLKAIRTVNGTILLVRPITRPSIGAKGEASVSMVKIVSIHEGEPVDTYPVGSVRTVPSVALITI